MKMRNMSFYEGWDNYFFDVTTTPNALASTDLVTRVPNANTYIKSIYHSSKYTMSTWRSGFGNSDRHSVVVTPSKLGSCLHGVRLLFALTIHEAFLIWKYGRWEDSPPEFDQSTTLHFNEGNINLSESTSVSKPSSIYT